MELGAMKGLAQAAFFESLWVATVIPAAIPIINIVYQAQGDPDKIWKAGDGWKATIDELEKAQAKIEELSRRVGEDTWEGDDRTAFEQRMRDYVNQLDFAIVMAWAVAIAMWVLAMMIAVFIMLMFVIMTLLAIFATAICIAAATVVGSPAALELEAQANQFAATCLQVLSVGSQALTYTFLGTSGILGGFLAADMVGQAAKGNKDAFVNLAQATLNGADDMLKGTLNFLEQKYTGKLMGNVPASRMGVPLASRIAPLTPLEKLAATKGTLDTLEGGPAVTNRINKLIPGDSYGSEDDAGRTYVDKTQPKR